MAQSVLPGHSDFALGEPHFAFLRKFHAYSRRSLRWEESRLSLNLQERLRDLAEMLSPDWSVRIPNAMRRLEKSFSAEPVAMTAAHNDFTPWNIRIQDGVARIFDWEYACQEQLPLFDPLHFVLMPMALARRPKEAMLAQMHKTLQLCSQRLGSEAACQPRAQALAYLMNLCTLYLWGARHTPGPNLVLAGYAQLIDQLINAA